MSQCAISRMLVLPMYNREETVEIAQDLDPKSYIFKPV